MFQHKVVNSVYSWDLLYFYLPLVNDNLKGCTRMVNHYDDTARVLQNILLCKIGRVITKRKSKSD